MYPYRDIAITALAPIIWGTTYYVTTEFLPNDYPITAAMLRALPAGLFLLLIVRKLPQGHWWWKMFVLGALNFSIFWVLLFITAYRLPGGIAATLGAAQPIVVIFLAYLLLGNTITIKIILAATAGVGGVALLVLTPSGTLDFMGVIAGIGSACAMATGTVLTKKWQPPTSLLTYTAWQLTAGGILLIPLAIWLEPPLPPVSLANLMGFLWLSIIGAALSYFIWFRGLTRINMTVASTLGFLSPTTAVVIGWLLLGETLTVLQIIGVTIVLSSIWFSQYLAQVKGKQSRTHTLNYKGESI
ncbi:MAG: DMT family transporter [Cellvibrionaceae bacterium]